MSDTRQGPHGALPPRGESPPGAVDLERLREEILDCDHELIRTLARRRELVWEVGALKDRHGLQVTDPKREAVVARRAATLARSAGVDEELVRNLIWQIMASARKQQYPSAAQSEGEPTRPREG